MSKDEVIMLTPKEIITTISNKKTGEVYKDEEALKAANIPEVILLFKTVTVGVLAEVTFIDLIMYVSLTKGLPVPNKFSALPVVSSFIPTNLY